jgi:hypothetical protein
MLGLISSSSPSGDSMDTCGVNVAAMPASRCMSSRSRTASRGRASMPGAARERRAERHAEAHARRACRGVRIDDALLVLRVDDYQR